MVNTHLHIDLKGIVIAPDEVLIVQLKDKPEEARLAEMGRGFAAMGVRVLLLDKDFNVIGKQAVSQQLPPLF